MPALADTARPTDSAAAPDPRALAPAALTKLRAGGPDQLRVLIARSLGALGLTDLASAWTETIPATPELAPVIAQLRQALAAMPGSRIDPEERIAHAHETLGAHPELAGAINAWAERERGRVWHRAKDGTMIEVDPSVPIDDAGAFRVLERQSAVAQHPPSNMSVGGGPPAPVILDGLLWAEDLLELDRRLPRLPNRAWAGVHAVETDPMRALDTLADARLAPMLEQTRLRLWIGHDARQRLAEYLREQQRDWSSLCYIPAAGKPDALFCRTLETLRQERVARFQSLRASNNARYAGRDRRWWRDRFEAARSGAGEPLRALVLTTRFSTYIQHASRDIAAALNAQGVRAELLIEPDDSAGLDGLTLAEAVDRHEPDLFVLINYTRERFVSAMPRSIPHVCWIQDGLPHLFSEETAKDVDELTSVVGGVFSELVLNYRYPVDRCLRFGVPASSAKFRAETIERPTCDLFVATNHGESPEAFRDRLEQESVSGGGPAGLIGEVHEAISGNLSGWRSGFLVWWLESTLEQVFEARGIETGTPMRERVIRDVAVPMVNRMLRHRMLNAAADLADSRGWKLRIAGRGWEDHPRFSQYHIGEVPHGPELRDRYRDSLLTLHTSASWLFHQRLHECALAGGMCAVMLKPDDLAATIRPAREQTRHGLRPTCTRLFDRRMCVRAWDHPVIAGAVSLGQRLFPETPAEPDQSDDAAQLIRTGLLPWISGYDTTDQPIPELERPIEQLRYIDALSETMFRDADRLAAVVERCKEEPEWRAARIAHTRSLVESCFTYEVATRAVVVQVERQLAR